MPVFNFECPECHKAFKRLLSPEQAKEGVLCECGAKADRTMQPPSSRTVEKLDNGLMPRSIERLADAERLFREHSKVKTQE